MVTRLFLFTSSSDEAPPPFLSLCILAVPPFFPPLLHSCLSSKTLIFAQWVGVIVPLCSAKRPPPPPPPRFASQLVALPGTLHSMSGKSFFSFMSGGIPPSSWRIRRSSFFQLCFFFLKRHSRKLTFPFPPDNVFLSFSGFTLAT